VVSVPDTPATNTIVLDFLAIPGQASFNLDTTDVGQYTLIVADITLVHSGAVITGASSPLTVKPFGLAVTGILAGATPNPGATTPGGTLFTDAGSNFAATVEAVLWDAADDTNDDGVLDTGVYANNIKAPSYAWDTTLSVAVAGFEPSTGTAGTLSNGLILQARFIGGTASPADLAYSEVGSFTLQSLASDYLGLASADIVGDDIIIGRFRPASFTISATVDGMFANTCTAYTYIGEGFGYDVLHPSFEVSAMNALGVPGVTANYTGIWAKLDADSVSLTAPTADQTQVGSDTVTLMALSYTQDAVKFNVTDNADGSFDFEFADDQFVYDKDSNSEITPFNSDIDLLITDVSDTEGVTNSGSFSLTPIAANLRFGRLKLSNVHGSELIDLAMPMVAEYLVSTSVYTLNTDDNCTTIADGHLVITDNLSTPGSSTVTVTNTTAISGDLGVGLTAPGSGGIDGYIDVSPDLSASSDAWLRYDWTGTGSFTEDPTGRATFGIYSGNDVNIYRSQTYQ
jgi:MSHA biogenesis protein MshQ